MSSGQNRVVFPWEQPRFPVQREGDEQPLPEWIYNDLMRLFEEGARHTKEIEKDSPNTFEVVTAPISETEDDKSSE